MVKAWVRGTMVNEWNTSGEWSNGKRDKVNTLMGVDEFEARVVVRREEAARPSRSVDNITRNLEGAEEERGESLLLVFV